MSDKPPSGEKNRNIWAPWRMEYIDSLSDETDGCFLCNCRDAEGKDAENLILWRGPQSLAVLNRFPYAAGHSLIAPYEHTGDLGRLNSAAMREMMEQVRDVQQLLKRVVRAQGFNIGINLGRCAGAGLPDHVHVHVVPRWAGDTNFMSVFANVRVIPQALAELYEQLIAAAGKMNLPALSG